MKEAAQRKPVVKEPSLASKIDKLAGLVTKQKKQDKSDARLWKEARSHSDGFWVSPYGRAVRVSGNTHVADVIAHPDKYGMTLGQIEDIYKKHGEPVGQEGEAREEILVGLIRSGWIRVRNYGNRGWSVNVARYSDKVKDLITEFFQKLYGRELSYDQVNIDHPLGVERTDVHDILNYKLFSEGRKRLKKSLVVMVESLDEIPESEIVKYKG